MTDENKNENSESNKEGNTAPAAPKRLGPSDAATGAALEVAVDHNVEKAIKVLKRRLIKEGLFRELKQRRFYEKPSEKKKRKKKESLKKIRKEESRNKKNANLQYM